MPSSSGQQKIQRAVNQLENAERLLLGLPKMYFRKRRDRELIEKLAKEILSIKETIQKEILEQEGE